MNQKVYVAVLLATYNGEKFLKEQLDSLLQQTVRIKVYIHDDGSLDSTLDIIRSYCVIYPEVFFLLEDGVTYKNPGDNFLHLTRFADEPYMMFCDQDDIWLPHKVESALAKMLEKEKEKGVNCPILAFSDLQVVDENLKLIAQSYMDYQHISASRCSLKELVLTNIVTGCTCMFNKALAKKALERIDVYSNVKHEWWLALVARLFGEIVFSPDTQILYRQHENNVIGARDKRRLSYICYKTKQVKNSLRITYAQADELLNTYKMNLPLEIRRFFEDYAGLAKQSKAERTRYYIKNGLRKGSIIETIGLYLLG